MKFLMVSASVLAIATINPASAQETAGEENPQQTRGGLEEIVVTATKRAENLQDVPVAISAISAESLQNKGVFETTDLNNTMPNLQVSSPFGQQQPNFSLRGVGVGTEFNANAASPVGVYVDEVYQAFRSSHGQQLYDLEQIEVVRGPQGTLYGRNTTGGAINFITRSPQLDTNEGYLTVGYGNYDRFNMEGAVEVSPVEGVFGLRAAVSYVTSDPYRENVFPAGLNTFAANGASGLNFSTGISPGGYESFSGRVTLRWQPTERLDLKAKVYAAETEGGQNSPVPFGQSLENDVIDYTNPNFLLAPLFQQLAPLGLVPASYSASARGIDKGFEIEADTIGISYSRARGAVFDARYELSDDLRLVSISGWDDGEYTQTQTECDATPLRLCSIGYSSTFEAFNQDLRLDYDGGPFKLIVGAYYGWDEVVGNNTPDFFNFLSDVRATFGLPATYFNPGGNFSGNALSATSLPTGVRATQTYRQVRTSIAGYGEGSYEVTPTVTVTGGLRYTKDTNDIRDAVSTFFDDAGNPRLITVSDFQQDGAFAPYFLAPVRDEAGNVVIPSFVDLGIPVPGPLERDGGSKSVTGRLIVDWEPRDDMLFYASYSRGYRAGTYNGLAYGSANQVYFVEPEEVDAFEVGMKARFLDGSLQLNAAAFYYDYKGQQGQVVDNTATSNLISLDGKLRGLEVEAVFQPIDQLTLSASVGVLDSEYADGECPDDPSLIPSFPAQLGSCVVSSAGPVSVAGNPFPYAPDISGNVGFDWQALETANGSLLVHGDANYVGQFYYDAFEDYTRGPLPLISTGQFSQGGGEYWILNGRVTWSTDRYSLALWGKNLTNELYFPFGISVENLFANSLVVRGDPRTYGVEATVRF